MTISQLIIGWFYYGIFYMGLSVFATLMLNKVVKNYWLSPLIINAFAVFIFLGMILLRLINGDQLLFNLFYVYMPIVAASVTCNLVLYLHSRLNKSR